MPFTFADISLLVTVTVMATAIAYIHNPRIKALIYTLPLPFLSARYASGQPVDATHVLGMFATLAFLTLTLVARRSWKWPIVAAEALGLAAFCGLGWAIGQWMPRTELAFWLAMAAVAPGLLVLRLTLKPVAEPGHRTRLPAWVKVPIIFAIVLAVVAAKDPLRGFMPTFPFVGTFAVYESRHSLRTLIRQFIRFCIGFEGLLATMRLLQPVTGEMLWLRLAAGVAAGAAVYLLATGGRLTLPPVMEPPSAKTEPSPGGGR